MIFLFTKKQKERYRERVAREALNRIIFEVHVDGYLMVKHTVQQALDFQVIGLLSDRHEKYTFRKMR